MNRVILFGGLSRTSSHFNDLHMFDVDTATWLSSKYAPDLPVPAARGFHSVTLIGSTIYLFGGSADFDQTEQECKTYFNDLFVLDIAPLAKLQIALNAQAPPPTTTAN